MHDLGKTGVESKDSADLIKYKQAELKKTAQSQKQKRADSTESTLNRVITRQ